MRLLISGLVQGVFFRYAAQAKAKELGLAGWVRNLPDGKVECAAEGERNCLEAFRNWAEKGPPLAVVERVETAEEPLQGEEDFLVV